MKQYRILRKIKTIALTAGGIDSIDLPRDYDYETLFLRVSGAVNVTVAGAAVRPEAPTQMIRTVEIVTDGKNTLYKAPFWFPVLANTDRPLAQSGARAVTPPTAASIASYNVEALGVIDFATIKGVRPKDSAFRSGGLSTFQLNVAFGAANDLFTGTPTAAFVGCTLEVFAQQIVELPDRVTGKITTPFAMKRVSFSEQSLPSSNGQLEMRLPSGNLIRSVFVRPSVSSDPSIAVLNNAILQSGVDVRLNLTGPQIRHKNSADNGQVTTGYYSLDLTARGGAAISLGDLWDVTGSAEPKLIADVTGGVSNALQLVTTEYILR